MQTATANPLGPMTDHFDGRRFFNPGQPSTDRSVRELLRWRLGGTRHSWPKPDLIANPATPAARSQQPVVTMVGHASVLIQVASLNILVDPVWSERVSPFRSVGPKRWNPPGIAFDALPPIDAVLLSHNHYDHLDIPTLARLAAAHRPRLIAPLGNGPVLSRAAPGLDPELGDWNDRFDLAPGAAVTLHPAYHWSARGLNDRRMALWCGFVIEAAGAVIYVAGDTAYGDGAPFRLVHARFGPPTVAILPIGAYEPRWFMRYQHVNPDEAVRILLDCGAQQALGVHWGTFQLTDEPRLAPLEALETACHAHAINPARFTPLYPGDVWTGNHRPEQTP